MPNTGEKLIELIEQGYNKYFNPNIKGDFFAVIADHLIANGVTFAEDNNVPSKWISVKDRLPEIKTEVLVYTGTSVFSHTFFATDSIVQSCVTHWMPLPSTEGLK